MRELTQVNGMAACKVRVECGRLLAMSDAEVVETVKETAAFLRVLAGRPVLSHSVERLEGFGAFVNVDCELTDKEAKALKRRQLATQLRSSEL